MQLKLGPHFTPNSGTIVHTRFFRCVSGKATRINDDFQFLYIKYRCSNCQKSEKTYSLAAKLNIDFEPEGKCYKFGELPAFGPPVSPKLIKLIGPDRDEFLKGRRCENQGLGVGSFIYLITHQAQLLSLWWPHNGTL
ncbi:MAG: hypothetical protein RPU91_13135 [Candidatus Sedimenticola sp. (ex Thyasira tokunagai)]